MTRRFPEPELRQLYEWWRRGDISLRAAARCGSRGWLLLSARRFSTIERAVGAVQRPAPALTTIRFGGANDG